MAELGIIGLMISSTTTATAILGLIKRRCGASESVVALTEKCYDQVSSIRELLQTFEKSTELPYDALSTDTALKHRCREFKAIEKQLGKVDRRTKRASRTERFTMAQGWAKKLESIYNELQHMRQGVEHLALSWESRRAVVAEMEDIATIYATRNAEEHDAVAKYVSDEDEESDELVSANNADRIFVTGLKLSTRDWRALARYGRLQELSLPDALFEAGRRLEYLYEDLETCNACGDEISKRSFRYLRHSLRLMRLSADLQHPLAHHYLGWIYFMGGGIEKDLEKSISHFKIAVDSGVKHAIQGLAEVYAKVKQPEMAHKYFCRAAELGIYTSREELVLRLAMGPELLHDTEEARKWLNRSHQPLFRSFCNFFGVAVDRNERKAIQCAEAANIEDAKYHVSVKKVKAISKTFLDLQSPLNSQLHSVWRLFRDLTTRSTSKLFQKWFDHLFDHGLQSVVICQLNNGYSMLTGKQYENYAMRSANDGNVVGHLALAQYSCYSEDYSWKRAERHLRIAAEMGHFSTQAICRQLFGDREQISRGLNYSDSEEELQGELQNLRISRERHPLLSENCARPATRQYKRGTYMKL